jgi:hypothetical protein
MELVSFRLSRGSQGEVFRVGSIGCRMERKAGIQLHHADLLIVVQNNSSTLQHHPHTSIVRDR